MSVKAISELGSGFVRNLTVFLNPAEVWLWSKFRPDSAAFFDFVPLLDNASQLIFLKCSSELIKVN